MALLGASEAVAASRLGNLSGALLLGGESRRMGRDKAHLEWQGEPWATRAARLLDRLFVETLLVGGAAPEAAPGRRVEDPDGPACALRGLVAALETATSERVVVIATDLPMLSDDLLLALTAWPEADVVVPSDADGDHPLCAVYRRAVCAPVARRRLSEGDLSLRGLLDEVETSRVGLEDLGLSDLGDRALMNVNTPQDLARLGVA